MIALDGKIISDRTPPTKKLAIASQLNLFRKRNQLMSNLSIFTFEHQQVRFVGTAEKPEWIAVDLCNILEIKNPSDTLAKFEEDEKGVATDTVDELNKRDKFAFSVHEISSHLSQLIRS
ncbi:MAG: Bro-N domain-containing protein [Xenococcaceae cyanobacterium]